MNSERIDRNKWVRAGEAAQWAHVTVRSIERWARRGRIRWQQPLGWLLYDLPSLRRHCRRRGLPFGPQGELPFGPG